MSAATLPDRPTGPQVIAALEALAAATGQPLNELARPLSRNPTNWLRDVARAAYPAPHTVARVRALLTGAPLPDRRPYSRMGEASDEDGPKVVTRRYLPPEQGDRRYAAASREPRPFCAVRGDLGCTHFAPFREEVRVEAG